MSSSFSSYRFSSARHRNDRVALSPPLKLLKTWSRAGVGFRPLARDGNIYLSLTAGAVVALDEGTGQQIWKVDLPGTYSRIAMSNGACVLHDDGMLVYFDRELILVDLRHGEVTARYAVPQLALQDAVVDGHILVCEFEFPDRVSCGAFDLRNGALLREYPRLWNTGLAASQGLICGCFERRVLSGVEVESGNTMWSYPVEELGQYKDEVGKDQLGDLIGVPTIVGNLVVSAVLGHHAIALQIQTGKQVWVQGLRSLNAFNLSYYPDGKLYALGDRFFHALEAETGQVVDEYDCKLLFKQAGVAGPFTDLGISDEYIFAADFTGSLIAFHKTQHSIDWTFKCKSKVAALDAPVVLGNRMNVLDGRGNFYSFEGTTALTL